MATPEAPLIANGDHAGPDLDGNDDVDAHDNYDHGTDPPEADASATAGPFIWLLTLAAGISGLLFGYDTGVISATLVSVGTSLSGRTLTSLDKSLVTSCTSLFALFASPLSSVLADRYGRRRVILLADVLFAAGALVQAVSNTVGAMVAGRCAVGLAVGGASLVVPLYLAEVAPAAHRGRLVTLNVLAITLGQAIAYVVGWAFAEHGEPGVGWRWMVGLGAVPAVVQGAVTAYMPETPRWLVRAGRSAEAKRVVLKVSGATSARGRSHPAGTRVQHHHADAVVKNIELEIREERETRRHREGGGAGRRRAPRRPGGWMRMTAWRELFGEGRNRRALAIACLLQGLQQLCGFNSLMYYSATIFTMVGFRIPTLASLSVAVTNFVFTVAALLFVDRIGRRRMLLYSVPFMMLGLVLCAWGFSVVEVPPGGPGDAVPAPTSSASAATVILVSTMIYVAAYALGLGNVPWMQSELFPLSVRSVGSGVATATNWAANFVVGLSFLPLMDALSPTWTFVLYAGVCAVGYVMVAAIYPETTGLSLEEAAGLLENGWGVKSWKSFC